MSECLLTKGGTITICNTVNMLKVPCTTANGKTPQVHVNWQYLVDGELERQWPEHSTTALRYDLDPVGTDSEVHQHQRTLTCKQGKRNNSPQ